MSTTRDTPCILFPILASLGDKNWLDDSLWLLLFASSRDVSAEALECMKRSLLTWELVGFHVSARRNALSKFTMPAMSPTMTEGGIASWKKKEGDAFTSGDVILEIVRSLRICFATKSHLLDRKRIKPLWT